MEIPFSPRIFNEGGDTFYEDGYILGAIDESMALGKRTVLISEWSSRIHGKGHSKRALRWLRSEGFAVIAANGVGLIEDGVGDAATAYWLHMHSLGLVDVLLDDLSIDITPR